MKPRVFFLGPIANPRLAEIAKGPLIVGAASRKVIGIISALRSRKVSAWLVTTPVLSSAKFQFIKPLVSRDSIPILRYSCISIPIFNRLLAATSYLYFCVRVATKADRVVFYNFYPEYLPALAALFILGRRGIVDFEDLPTTSYSLREIVNRVAFIFTLQFMNSRIFVASNQIADKIRRQKCETRHLTIYGVMPTLEFEGAGTTCKREAAFRILYSGTILEDTGSTIVQDAIFLLRQHFSATGHTVSKENALIELVVTGFGDLSGLLKLEGQNENSLVHVRVHKNLSTQEYQETARNCNLALSLKLPNSELGYTTFPSKVLEFANMGLPILTFDFPEVKQLLGGDGCLVCEPNAESLADYVRASMALNPATLHQLGVRGGRNARAIYSDEVLALRIMDHLAIFRIDGK